MQTKNIIITGASTGIGRDMALAYAALGYNLGLIARRGELLEKLKREIEDQYQNSKVYWQACDITDYDTSQKVIADLAQKLGHLDIFIANAGMGIPTPGWKKNWGDIKRVFETNALGAIASLEAAKDIMVTQRSGHLVGISSIAAMRGLPATSAYSSSKVALSSYLEALRLDLKAFGITVTSIHPGFIETPMTEKNRFPMPFMLSSAKATQKMVKAIQKKKKRFYFPWPMAITYGVARLMPNFMYDLFVGGSSRKGAFH